MQESHVITLMMILNPQLDHIDILMPVDAAKKLLLNFYTFTPM